MQQNSIISNDVDSISWEPLSKLVLDVCDGPRTVRDSGKGIPYVRLRDLRNDIVSSGHESFTNTKVSAERFILNKGDVLIAKTGGEPRGTLVGNRLKNGTFSADVYKLRPNPELIHSEWLASFFNTEYAKKIIGKLLYGPKIKRLKIGALKEIMVPIPSIKTGSIVDAMIKDARQLDEAARDAFDAVERGIHSEISQRIPDFLKEEDSWVTVSNKCLEGRWDVPYVKNLTQTASTSSNDLFCRLVDVARIASSSRKLIKPDVMVRFVQTADMDSQFLTFNCHRTCYGKDLPPRVRLPLQEYQVLLLASGQNIGTTKQPVAVVEPELDGCIASNAFVALNFIETPIYFAMLLRHPLVLTQIRALSSGATIPFLSKKIIKELKIPVLGAIWREDFDQRAQIAWEKHKRALGMVRKAISIVEESIDMQGHPAK